MPIITGTKPSAWIGSSSRPTQDFSFLRGGGVSGGGSPDAFYESRPMGRRPKTEEEWLEEQRKKADAGEAVDLTKEPTAVDVLNSDVELGVGTWTAPVLDVDAVLPSMIDSGQLSINTVKAEYINANSLSAISSDLGTVTAGSITLDTAGFIKGGQTAYATGTGFWLGYDTSAYKFSIGSSTQYLRWDGTSLVIVGTDSSIDLGDGSIDAASISIGGEDISKLLNAIKGKDNLVLFTPNTRVPLQITGSGTVINGANGSSHVGASGSGDDTCYSFIPVADVIGNIDMANYFEVGVRLKITNDTPRAGSFIWIGMADILGTSFNNKSALSSVDHLGIFFEYTPSLTAYMKTGDGSSTTETSLGASYDPASGLNLRIVFDGTTVTYYINGTSVGTVTTTLPNQTNPTNFTILRSYSESSGTGDYFNTYLQNNYVILTSNQIT